MLFNYYKTETRNNFKTISKISKIINYKIILFLYSVFKIVLHQIKKNFKQNKKKFTLINIKNTNCTHTHTHIVTTT